jgi:hypothetical protein
MMGINFATHQELWELVYHSIINHTDFGQWFATADLPGHRWYDTKRSGAPRAAGTHALNSGAAGLADESEDHSDPDSKAVWEAFVSTIPTNTPDPHSTDTKDTHPADDTPEWADVCGLSTSLIDELTSSDSDANEYQPSDTSETEPDTVSLDSEKATEQPARHAPTASQPPLDDAGEDDLLAREAAAIFEGDLDAEEEWLDEPDEFPQTIPPKSNVIVNNEQSNNTPNPPKSGHDSGAPTNTPFTGHATAAAPTHPAGPTPRTAPLPTLTRPQQQRKKAAQNIITDFMHEQTQLHDRAPPSSPDEERPADSAETAAEPFGARPAPHGDPAKARRRKLRQKLFKQTGSLEFAPDEPTRPASSDSDADETPNSIRAKLRRAGCTPSGLPAWLGYFGLSRPDGIILEGVKWKDKNKAPTKT